MENSQSDSNTFSVRIVSIDYYMSPPITDIDICYSSFQGGKVNEVPVIRIYGSTPAGQKTCLHVHRALPYLYVPCSNFSLQTPEEGDMYTRDMARAIEKCLKSRLKGSTGSKRQHVHGCSLVRAKKFYGYHPSDELFVKIYLYYPHEVARVATLLLDDAILDRSFQPHESHIPYLLQFLVDYNLFGMGHLHISKVKFRHPVPIDFIPRMVDQSCNVHTHASEKLASNSVNHQADSSTDAHFSSPIWVSSTVPSGWMWPPPVVLGGSPDQEFHLIRRQSTCELEGDAMVDDILNQQFKMYSSLSQTGSEVKMVQSLVPIWEEEYQRTGMHVDLIYSDPDKPLPGDVLRTFAHGPEFEDALLDLCREAGNLSSSQVSLSEGAEIFLQSVKSLTDVGNLGEFDEHVNPKCSNGESLPCSEERSQSDILSSQGLLSKPDDDAISSECGLEFSELAPGDEEMLTHEKTEASDPKGIDKEALGLLRWLASSQGAEEDLNTDDELLHDLVLTPLLPKTKTTINEVLEKANLGYECESQQECQDILDSVEDTIYSDILKEQTVHSTTDNHSAQTSTEKIIPQVDGFCDNELPNCAGTPSEIKPDNEMKFSHHVVQSTDIGLSSERKRNNKLWGSLPFAVQQKVNDEKTASFCFTDVCNEIKIDNHSSSSSGNKVDQCCDNTITNLNTNSSDLKEGNKLIGCSMRDLMRRKRCHRVEPSEDGTCRVKKILLGKERKETFVSPKRLEFHTEQSDMEAVIPRNSFINLSGTDQHGASYKRSSCTEISVPQVSTLKNEIFGFNERPDDIDWVGASAGSQSVQVKGISLMHTETVEVPKSLDKVKQDSARCLTPVSKNVQIGYSPAKGEVPDTCSERHKNTNADVLQTDNCASLEGDFSGRRFAEYIEMNFSKKPPTIDLLDPICEDTAFTPAVQDNTSMRDMENPLATLSCHSDSLASVERNGDEIFPFFLDNVQDEKGVHNESYKYNVSNSQRDAALGVPVHYQNDGSILYLLTTSYSPPSVDSVHKWLLDRHLQDDAEGPSRECVHSELLVSSSPSYSNSSCFLDTENHLPNDVKTASEFTNIKSELVLVNASHESLPASRSVAHKDPYLDQLDQENCNNSGKGIDHHYAEGKTELLGKGAILEGSECTEKWQDISQISGPDIKSKLTPLSQVGFRDPASVGAGQQLTLMCIEVQAESRGGLRPDPRFDAVTIIAVVVQEDNGHDPEVFVLLCGTDGEPPQRSLDGISGCKVVVVHEEKHLYDHFVKIVRSFDPDILMGWEIQGGSLGFLAERAANLGVSLLDTISRTPSSEAKVSTRNLAAPENGIPDNQPLEALVTDPVVLEDAIIEDEWGRTHASGVHVGGRIVLNVWRLMRNEVKLNMYTIESVAEEVLRRKIPSIPFKILTQWFASGPGRARFRCIEYVVNRAKLNLEIMSQLDMINRTSELARVFGIDFFSVLSRGSQYRVESMLLRLAHTQNYLAISPGKQQVASQPAMECLPLVMEPESGFYADPVVVLDFQSLYPSMIIAYNLCFCTSLGKVVPSIANILGVTSYSPDPHLLNDLKNQILLAPNGVMYVPSKVRKGVLPRLLEEILTTRIMVKRAMKKLTSSERVLFRIFNARQLALKLISNVTYGYTAAGFSGRMPCAELADSIVQCGRRTLEKAISFVNSNDKWKARVIYGDTDSMFVLLKGRTRKEAFRIGQEIASEITSMNPDPVTLKMEKVYHPCFLLTKKRYVGYSYESPDQAEALFDAKGIETVRRDSCMAVAKTLEKSLRFFFEHQDISKIKVYLQRQWNRIMSGRVSLQDFIFAKEVRLGTYSARASSLPPAAIVATKAMRADPRAEPRYAERIPYVVIHGEPGARLIDVVVDPLDLLAIESPFRLNDLYYINKQIIPALQRVFGLVGADLNQWFSEMPRLVRPGVGKQRSYAPNAQRTRIDYYYLSKHCFVCGELVQASSYFCDKCCRKGPAVATAVIGRTTELERDIQHLAAICRHCGGGDWIVESGVKCTSLSCELFYQRRKVQKELQTVSAVATDVGFYPKCNVEWF